MGWRFRKTFRKGGLQASVTKNGAGASIGVLGLCRIGITPKGQFFISFSVPKTGLYWIHYFGKPRRVSRVVRKRPDLADTPDAQPTKTTVNI